MQETFHVLTEADFIERISDLPDWTSFAIYRENDTYSCMMWEGQPLAVTISMTSSGDRTFIQYDGTESVLRNIKLPFTMHVSPGKGSALKPE